MALGAATAHGVNYRKGFVTKPRVNVNTFDAHGTVRCIVCNVDSVDIAAAVVAETHGNDDIIYIGGEKIPASAVIIDAAIISDATPTAGDLILRVDETVLVSEVAVDAPAIQKKASASTAAVAGAYPITVAAGDDGILNFLVGATGNLTGTFSIYAIVWYVQD